MIEPSPQYPHCDMTVLHAPGQCVYCDKYPGLQMGRLLKSINFTGQNNPYKVPDPATEGRPLERINLWHGNRPYTKEELDAEWMQWEREMEVLANLNPGLYARVQGYTPQPKGLWAKLRQFFRRD